MYIGIHRQMRPQNTHRAKASGARRGTVTEGPGRGIATTRNLAGVVNALVDGAFHHPRRSGFFFCYFPVGVGGCIRQVVGHINAFRLYLLWLAMRDQRQHGIR